MSKLQEKIKQLNSINIELFELSGNNFAPMILIIGDELNLNFTFPMMETNQQKNEMALMTICVSALLEGVNYIAFCAESWIMEIDEKREPEIFKKFKGSPNEFMAAIHAKYPSVEECPHHKEVIMATMCDGKKSMSCYSEIIRGADDQVIRVNSESIDHNEVKSTLDPHQRFAGMLAKSNHLKIIMAEVMNDATMFGIDDDMPIKFIGHFIKHYNAKYKLGINVERCFDQVKKVMADVKKGSTEEKTQEVKVTVH